MRGSTHRDPNEAAGNPRRASPERIVGQWLRPRSDRSQGVRRTGDRRRTSCLISSESFLF